MGDFGTYCGTELVRYLSQVKFDQLAYFKALGEPNFNNWIEGTMIPSAERFIDSFCNHAFGTPGFGTMVLDGNGKSTLWFPPRFSPLLGIAAGSVDGVGITLSDIYAYTQHVRYESNFPRGKQNVVLYGSFGYLDGFGVPEVPPDVGNVCGQLCANLILDMVRKNMAPDLFQALMAGGDVRGGDMRSLWAMPNIFTPPMKEMLKPYRILWIDVG